MSDKIYEVQERHAQDRIRYRVTAEQIERFDEAIATYQAAYNVEHLSDLQVRAVQQMAQDLRAELSDLGGMHTHEYQRQVARTIRSDADFSGKLHSFVLGLAGESGEVADIVKKAIHHGHDLRFRDTGVLSDQTRAHLLDELGDVAWYLTALCEILDASLLDVLQHNVDKLTRRYPNGFSEEASRNRAEYANT